MVGHGFRSADLISERQDSGARADLDAALCSSSCLFFFHFIPSPTLLVFFFFPHDFALRHFVGVLYIGFENLGYLWSLFLMVDNWHYWRYYIWNIVVKFYGLPQGFDLSSDGVRAWTCLDKDMLYFS